MGLFPLKLFLLGFGGMCFEGSILISASSHEQAELLAYELLNRKGVQYQSKPWVNREIIEVTVNAPVAIIVESGDL